jgi:ABC-type multidrug transport system fused ATPase/permease subunit
MLTEKNIQALIAGFFVFLMLSVGFHRDPDFAGSALGHSLGIAGTVLIFMAMIYPFRKRILKKKGRQNPLNSHIAYGLVGPSLVVIHAAHDTGSLIGTLVFLALLIVVLSGIIGRFLYLKVNRSVREQQAALELLKNSFYAREKAMRAALAARQGDIVVKKAEPGRDSADADEESLEQHDRLMEEAWSISELEYAVTFSGPLKRMFSWWMQAHNLFTVFLFALIAVHVLATLYYGLRWLP